MLGLIFEDENNIEKACDSYFICADLTKKDSSKWFRAYELSEKLKLHKRQMYCLARLIHLLPDNPSVYEKRARLLLEDDQFSRAFSDLLSCARYAPDPFSSSPSCTTCRSARTASATYWSSWNSATPPGWHGSVGVCCECDAQRS